MTSRLPNTPITLLSPAEVIRNITALSSEGVFLSVGIEDSSIFPFVRGSGSTNCIPARL